MLQCEKRVRPERRWLALVHVDMRRLAVFRVEQADRPRDVVSPIAPLRHVLVVPQLQHQPVSRLGVLREREAFLLRRLREPVPGQTQRHEVKRWAVGSRLRGGQLLPDLARFDETAGPAVDEQQWYRVLDLRCLMDEVDFQRVEAVDGDGSRELWHLVQLLLGRPPVVLVLPVCRQAFDVREGRPIVPFRAL